MACVTGNYDNGEIRIDGVTYVEDDIAFDGRGANGSEYKFIGNGLIVAGKNRGSNDIFKMHIKKNITLADNSTLGLITNFLEIDQDCQIHASVYSDNAAGIKNATIFGNYIIDNFERSNYSGGFNVRYTSKNIAVPGTDFYDPNDKITNKRRYYASFANNWSNSYYAKE